MNSLGYIRNLSGKGLYLASEKNCLSPMLETAAYDNTKWTFQPAGDHEYEYIISSACGNRLVGEEGKDTIAMDKSVENAKWFVIPVGKAQYSSESS